VRTGFGGNKSTLSCSTVAWRGKKRPLRKNASVNVTWARRTRNLLKHSSSYVRMRRREPVYMESCEIKGKETWERALGAQEWRKESA